MNPLFDYPIVYEDRDSLLTARWALQGISTKDDGNTDRGWLWMTAADTANTVAVSLFKDAAAGTDDKVLAGTIAIAGIADDQAKCSLTEENDSGMTGEFYAVEYTTDPVTTPVLVTLCMDADLAVEYANLSDLPEAVYDLTNGMARFCAAATHKTLLLASQLYADELGGYGAPEYRHAATSARLYPQFSRLASPDQLQDAAVHWALMLAFGSCHEMHTDTMYSTLRDYHDEKRKEAIGSWRLAINTDPSDDDDADEAASASSRRLTRV